MNFLTYWTGINVNNNISSLIMLIVILILFTVYNLIVIKSHLKKICFLKKVYFSICRVHAAYRKQQEKSQEFKETQLYHNSNNSLLNDFATLIKIKKTKGTINHYNPIIQQRQEEFDKRWSKQ